MGVVSVVAIVWSVWLAQADPEAPAAVFETVVTGAPVESRDGASALSGTSAASVPGAAGDLGRALENLPGVARLAPGSDGLVLWGATPQESRVLLDGVEIPALFHFGSWRSVLPTESLRDATVYPGAFAANFGRATGGIVQVRSADAGAEAHHAWLAADLLDTSLGARGPIGEQGGYLASARLGYLDRLQSAVTSPESRALVPLPAYRDGFVKATLLLGDGRSLTVQAIAASDRRALSLDTQSPVDTLVETHARDFGRAIVRFQQAGDDGTTTATVFIGADSDRLDQQLGLVPVSLHSHATSMGARLAHVVLVGDQMFEIGLDSLVGLWSLTRHGSLTEPGREGDETVFGATPGGAVASDQWRPVLGELAPYALAELSAGRWNIRPGVRVVDDLISSDRSLPPTGLTPRVGFSRSRWAAEPRLAVAVAVTRWLDLSVAAGVHHQLPDAADLSPTFGSPSLGPSRAVDGVCSAALHLRDLAVESSLFARKLDDLAVRNPDPQPALAQSLVQGGQGRSYGAQAMLRRDCRSGLCGLLSYTLSRSQRRAPGEPDWRLFDQDQTHVLAAVLGYRTRRWFAGARFRYATGMPRTPVVGAYYDGTADLFRPVLGAHNASRLPAFAELDLRAERTWQHRGLRLTVSFDVLDATDRKNPEEIVYSGDYSRRSYVTGLPIFATVGFRLEI